MARLQIISRRIARVAALVFCAWWLVATSSSPEPPRECFTGLGDTARIQVLLGASSLAEGARGSCQGLDGLATGSTLVLDLVRETTSVGCIGYRTVAVSGTSGVGTPSNGATSDPQFTRIDAGFSPPERPGCTGNWMLTLDPETTPPAGQLISPLDAGPDRRWFVRRLLQAGPPDKCGLPPVPGDEPLCGDRFVVDAIAEVPAP